MTVVEAMRNRLMCALFMVLAGLCLQPKAAPAARTLALTNVTLVDGTGAPAQPGMTVIINEGRIATAGPVARIRLPRGAQVVEGTGKFLIPGLWDMHVHTSSQRIQFLPLFVANGVTGVRDMGSSWEHLERIARSRKEGCVVPTPSVVAAGPVLTGRHQAGPGAITIANPEEGRRAVDQLQKRGVDFVKIYDLLSRESYFAVVGEAKTRGMAFVGHVPASVTTVEASEAGQKSLEHTSFLLACSTQENDMRRALLGGDSPFHAFRYLLALWRSERTVETFSWQKTAELSAVLVKNDTWLVPTLVIDKMFASLSDTGFIDDARLKYLPPSVVQEWKPKSDFVSRYRAVWDSALYGRRYQKALEAVGLMHRAGVRFLVGTDTAVPYCFPGFGVHDELALLVRAGFTPMEALQAATRNPAIFLGLSDSRGTVEKGKVADLVLLEANPLEDIRNTRRIAAVILRGRLLTRTQLDALLAEVEAVAATH